MRRVWPRVIGGHDEPTTEVIDPERDDISTWTTSKLEHEITSRAGDLAALNSETERQQRKWEDWKANRDTDRIAREVHLEAMRMALGQRMRELGITPDMLKPSKRD